MTPRSLPSLVPIRRPVFVFPAGTGLGGNEAMLGNGTHNFLLDTRATGDLTVTVPGKRRQRPKRTAAMHGNVPLSEILRNDTNHVLGGSLFGQPDDADHPFDRIHGRLYRKLYDDLDELQGFV